jgi:hypothetical protein
MGRWENLQFHKSSDIFLKYFNFYKKSQKRFFSVIKIIFYHHFKQQKIIFKQSEKQFFLS